MAVGGVEVDGMAVGGVEVDGMIVGGLEVEGLVTGCVDAGELQPARIMRTKVIPTDTCMCFMVYLLW